MPLIVPRSFLPLQGAPSIAPVGVDLVGQNLRNTSNVTTFTYTMGGAGVGSGSKRALVAIASFSNPSAASPTSPSVVWNGTGTLSNLYSSNDASSNNGYVFLFGLLNPDPGNNNLVFNWSGATGISVACISLTGVLQTSVLAAFPDQNLNTGGPGVTGVTVTSASASDMIISGAVCPTSIASPNQTQIFLDSTAADKCAGQRSFGGASVTHSWNLGGFGPVIYTTVKAG
jgi:hypothetical protein